MKHIIIFFCLGFVNFTWSQTAWNWLELDTMPFRISNNAVTAATVSGNKFVYSFGGIDTTKLFSGITQRSFKYDVLNASWTEISPLPSTLANIAASASTVKDKIYIIGGYHVYSNGNEVSSNEVIIYNPQTDLYETNGALIPVAIDDQVQCVYKDSLIFVITGWSNTTNVPKVQIYNPTLDTWQIGSETPNTHDYKAFGGSGTIIGDTIYYFGGAKASGGFGAVKKLRKGIINASDPSQIIWSLEDDAPNNNYRSACLSYGNNLFWIGGSGVSYNYDGLSYFNGSGVLPLTQIMRYKSDAKTWNSGEGAPYSVMDLRGVAQVSPVSWIICGGMNENQQVTHRTFLLTYDPITGSVNEKTKTDIYVSNKQIFNLPLNSKLRLYDLNGKLVEIVSTNRIKTEVKGLYVLLVETNDLLVKIKVIL